MVYVGSGGRKGKEGGGQGREEGRGAGREEGRKGRGRGYVWSIRDDFLFFRFFPCTSLSLVKNA